MYLRCALILVYYLTTYIFLGLFSYSYTLLNSSTIDELVEGVRKDGGATSTRAKRAG